MRKLLVAVVVLMAAAGCLPYEEAAYVEASKPEAQPVLYPQVAENAANGEVYEYH
jgi:hypothetical protein